MAANVHIIIGPPGTGKTTEIARQVQRRIQYAMGEPDPVAVFSLTKAAAAEAAGRDMPIRRECVSTLHAAAYRAIGRPDIAEAHAGEFRSGDPDPDAAVAADAQDLDEPEWNQPENLTTACRQYQECQVLRARMVPRDKWPPEVNDWYDGWCKWKTAHDYADFTDLIERAIEETTHAPTKPRHIYVDEAQDCSRLELELVRKWTVAGQVDSLSLIGDPWQSLYEWRGAQPGMFAGVDRTVLRQSYRLPQAVHRHAIGWMRQRLYGYEPIEFEPRDEVGQVRRDWPATYQNIDSVIHLIAEEQARGRSVMIQAACNYLITPTLAALRTAGIPFANPWRKKRGDWNPLSPGRGTSMGMRLAALITPPAQKRIWTAREAWQWSEPLVAQGLFQRGRKAALKALAASEQAEVGLRFDDLAGLYTADALTQLWAASYESADNLAATTWWRDRLKPQAKSRATYPMRVLDRAGVAGLTEPPRCYVGTIHSFKGSEADTVIVYPDLSRAGDAEWHSSRPGGRNPVVRMGYVGVTRAREKLIICRAAKRMSMPL